MPWNGIAGSFGKYMFHFNQKVALQFWIPTSNVWELPLFTAFPALGNVYLFKISHSSGYVAVFHHGFMFFWRLMLNSCLCDYWPFLWLLLCVQNFATMLLGCLLNIKSFGYKSFIGYMICKYFFFPVYDFVLHFKHFYLILYIVFISLVNPSPP